jgi:hypothetical protein
MISRSSGKASNQKKLFYNTLDLGFNTAIVISSKKSCAVVIPSKGLIISTSLFRTLMPIIP